MVGILALISGKRQARLNVSFIATTLGSRGQRKVREFEMTDFLIFSPKPETRNIVKTGRTMTVDLQPRRIRITIGGVKVEAELNPTRTAQQVYAALPIETSRQYVG